MADEVLVDGEVYDRGADLVEQHAEDVAGTVFLVLTHEGEEFLGVAEGIVGQGGELGSHGAVAVQHCLRETRQAHRELHCAEHAYAHGVAMEDYYEAEIVLAVSERLLQEHFEARAEEVKAELKKTQDLRLLSGLPFLMSNIQGVTGRIERNLIRRAGIRPEVRASAANIGTVMDMCVLGEGACFCPEDLLQTLSTGAADSLFILHFPEGETTYPVRFGWRQEESGWKMLKAFIETAKRTDFTAVFPGREELSTDLGKGKMNRMAD